MWKRHRRFSMNGTWDRLLTRLLAQADAAGTSTGRCRSTPRSTALTSTAPPFRGTQGARRTTRIRCSSRLTTPWAAPAADFHEGAPRLRRPRPATGRAGRPGQAHDGPILPFVLGAIAVPQLGPGRARTRPDAVLADKAYSSRATRRLLRSRGITAVIPEPRDQQAHRKRRGRRGGRPVGYDPEGLQGPQRRRALPQRTQAVARPGHPLRSSPSSTPAAPSWPRSSPGYADKETRPRPACRPPRPRSRRRTDGRRPRAYPVAASAVTRATAARTTTSPWNRWPRS